MERAIPDVAIGIDLAWTDGKASGACALERTGAGWQLIAAEAQVWSNQHIIEWVTERLGTATVVAVDAPLWIPNEAGARDCDRVVISRYHRFKIGVYPCNRQLFADRPRSEDLRERLMAEGFREAPEDADRVFFETYPHPAIVNMLGLDERIAYKRGRVAKRRKKLRMLGEALLQALPVLTPAVMDSGSLREALKPDLEALKGRALKQAEDRIDAVVCAYCAASWLDRGDQGSERIGKPGAGMMIFPKRGRSLA